MRIQIRDGNGQGYQIDSLNPQLLGRWLVEMVTRIRPDQVTWDATVSAWPSWDPETNRPDWLTDMRVIGQQHPFTSPRDFLAALAREIEAAEALHGAG